MVRFTSLLILLLMLSSCRKDGFYCSKDFFLGEYQSTQSNSTIQFTSVESDESKLRTKLPKINSYYWFSMITDVELSGCEFSYGFNEITVPGSGSPTYTLLLTGEGHFEENTVYLEYDAVIQSSSGGSPPWTTLTDTTISDSYVKI